MLTVYGIKNCNTMKKCFDFFNDNNIAYEFFDYKKQVLDFDKFSQFVETFGIEKVINKQGTTYKKLSDDDKAIVASGDLMAIYDLVKNNQSMLKRPIVIGEFNEKEVKLIGFELESYQAVFIV